VIDTLANRMIWTGSAVGARPSFLSKLFFQFSDAGDYISKFRIMIRE
jgi:hypothetical protein